jgi:hypothetical protein
MQLFSTAVREFSKDSNAKFDFIEVAMRNQPLPHDYANQLHEFFTLVYNYYKANGDPYNSNNINAIGRRGMSNQDAFETAAIRLSERLVDTFHHYIVRNQINVPAAGIPKALDERIEKVDALIRELMPCNASRQYDNIGLVYCDSTRGPHNFESHGDVHQSAQTYQMQVPREGLLKFLGQRVIRQACRWEGKFIVPAKYKTPKWFFDPAGLITGLVTATDLKFKQLVESQKRLLAQIKTTRLCLSCLLAVPTEVLDCNHMLCVDCCKEIRNGNVIECPFCDQEGTWDHVDVPDGAGYRVLSLDGGGVRGVVSSLMMQRLEEMLRIPIRHLFDLIVGTSAGGINALGYGISLKSGAEMTLTFQELSKFAYKKTFSISSKLLQFFFGSTYLRKPLRDALEGFVGNKPILGSTQMPRVAVLSAELSDGKPKKVLFASYNSATTPVECRRETRGSLLDAAQATTSGGTFFPVQHLLTLLFLCLNLFLS